jgi:hypothetical protein
MADPRIINLPNDPAGPDSSGVGRMLFDRMQSQFKDSEAAKQLDITEGIKAKYKAQADEKANQYNQGMEVLRSALTQGRTDAANQYAESMRTKAALGLQNTVQGMADTGMDLPGLTGDQGETMGTQTIPATAKRVDPNALDPATTLFEKGVSAHYKRKEQQTNQSYSIERDLIRNSLDLLTDADARQSEAFAASQELAGDTTGAAETRALFGTAGQGSHTKWGKYYTETQPKLEIAKAGQLLKLQLSKEQGVLAVKLQGMRNEARSLLAVAKVGESEYKRMIDAHRSMDAAVKRREDLLKIQSREAMTMMPGSPEERKFRIDMRANELGIEEDLAMMSKLRARMLEYGNRPAEEGAPAVPAPSGNDPMGLRPRKK